jgi:hypothetical protein
LGRWAGRVRRWWAGESVQLWTRACAAICWASCGSGGTCWGSCAGIAGKRAKWSVGGVGGRRSARLAVRNARGVCGSRVRSAGREEPRGGEPQRSRRTLARHVPPSRLFTVRFFFRDSRSKQGNTFHSNNIPQHHTRRFEHHAPLRAPYPIHVRIVLVTDRYGTTGAGTGTASPPFTRHRSSLALL